MNKAVLLACVWGLALLMSAVLRAWGHQHPASLQVSVEPVLVLLFAPAALMAAWLLWSSRGSGESE